MFAKLTRMTKIMLYFITTDGRTMTKNVNGGGAGMTKTMMPKVGGDGEAGVWSRRCSGDGVKVTNTIAAKHHATSQDIFDRKTKSVKFDRTVVVPSELMN
jgi:hypothetical protein